MNIRYEGPILNFTAYGQNDLPELLDAVAILRTRGYQFRLLIVGPRSQWAEEQVLARSVQGQMMWLGALGREQVPLAMRASDIGLLPYPDTLINRARWPVKLSDILAAGLPVVAGRVGDVSRLIEKHRVGLTYENPDEFALNLALLLDSLPLRKQMGERARRVAEEELHIDRQAGRLEAFYMRLLAEKGCASQN